MVKFKHQENFQLLKFFYYLIFQFLLQLQLLYFSVILPFQLQ